MQQKPIETHATATPRTSHQTAVELFRENTRAPLTAPVRLQFDTFSKPDRAYTANVSAGGMFVRSRKPRPVGTRLRFELRLEGFAKPAVGFAEVVWIRLKSSSKDEPTGMGLEFRYVDPPSRFRIEAAVCAAIENLRIEEEPRASLSGAGLRRPSLAEG